MHWRSARACPGARNAGIAAARHGLIAFIDDDERAHETWLAAISDEFSADSLIGCVSGLVLPAELDTTAQVSFEQFGGHSKGRGFQRVVFDERYLSQRQSPSTIAAIRRRGQHGVPETSSA